MDSTAHVGPAGRMLLRHAGSFANIDLLVVAPPGDESLLQLEHVRSYQQTTVVSVDYAAHGFLRARYRERGLDPGRLHYGVDYPPPEPLHDGALVFLPAFPGQLEWLLALAARAVAPGAEVALLGETRAGVRSARPALERIVGPIREADAARHCILYRARKTVETPARPLDAWAAGYVAELPDCSVRVVDFPGVFSRGRVDPGSRLLLEHLRRSPGGRVLDFGCGCGIIGTTLRLRFPPLRVDMVDTNALALEAARRTLRANGLPSTGVFASDGFSDVRGRYRQIVSNPPFHTPASRSAYDLATAEALAREAGAHLEHGGRVTLAGNRFLRYERLLECWVGPSRVVAEDGRYVVHEAQWRAPPTRTLQGRRWQALLTGPPIRPPMRPPVRSERTWPVCTRIDPCPRLPQGVLRASVVEKPPWLSRRKPA